MAGVKQIKMIYRIIQNRKIFLWASGIVFIASMIGLIVFGLKPGIDFTGGSRFEISFPSGLPSNTSIGDTLNGMKIEGASIQPTANKTIIIKSRALSNDERSGIIEKISTLSDGSAKEVSFNAIGPTIGKELQRKAIWSVGLVILAIIVYITWAFRKVSLGPVPSWVYGIGAVIALLHDLAFVVGLFVLFGKLLGTEVDTLFVTALLTVLGFSVHDTIVVFDRIREGIRKHAQMPFEELVNLSINETLARSINTSLTALFVLVAMAVLGGESIRMFVVALIAGIIVGTYSSIFIASPIILVWHNLRNRR